MSISFVPVACATLVLAAIPWSPSRQAATEKTAAPAKPKIESLAWMCGDWESPEGATQVDEHWTHIAGGTMFGTSRTVAHGKTVFFEFLRIETRGEDVYYVAQPGGGRPTPFKLSSVESQRAVFENLEHDFPKRVIYQREANGDLFARVEGDGSEPEKAQEFRYQPRKSGVR